MGPTGRIAEPDLPYRTGEIPKPNSSRKDKKLVHFLPNIGIRLRYLQGRITTLLGREGSVVLIHGGVGREERLKAQESFRHDPDVQVLLATDAAGEGINLQRATFDGKLRFALEPQPIGTTLRANSPYWSDRSLSSLELGRE